MKKIYVTGEDLFLRLSISPLEQKGETKSSFPIEISFIEEGGKISEAALILYERNTLHESASRTLMSFQGIISTDGKEMLFFNGMFDKEQSYEDCYLLVLEPEIFESNISHKEFVALTKKYCESRNIPTREDGNIFDNEFPLLENPPKDANAPAPALRDRKHKDMEIYTIMCDSYFPMMYSKTIGKEAATFFGKFIGENLIKVFSKEQVRLLRDRPIFTY